MFPVVRGLICLPVKDPTVNVLQDFFGYKSGHLSHGFEGAIQVELFKISLPEHWFELRRDLSAKRVQPGG